MDIPFVYKYAAYMYVCIYVLPLARRENWYRRRLLGSRIFSFVFSKGWRNAANHRRYTGFHRGVLRRGAVEDSYLLAEVRIVMEHRSLFSPATTSLPAATLVFIVDDTLDSFFLGSFLVPTTSRMPPPPPSPAPAPLLPSRPRIIAWIFVTAWIFLYLIFRRRAKILS